MAARIKPDKITEYKRLHAAVWPEVTEALTACGIFNYSIYMHDDLAFGYLEYSGDDLAADLAAMAGNPTLDRWEEICDECQVPISDNPDSGLWTMMEEIFHLD